MDELEKNGTCGMKIQTEILKRDFRFIEDDCIEFKTHQDLDQFINKLLDYDPDFFKKEEKKYIVNLLKSFDRAFWLR